MCRKRLSLGRLRSLHIFRSSDTCDIVSRCASRNKACNLMVSNLALDHRITWCSDIRQARLRCISPWLLEELHKEEHAHEHHPHNDEQTVHEPRARSRRLNVFFEPLVFSLRGTQVRTHRVIQRIHHLHSERRTVMLRTRSNTKGRTEM